ncbi:MAG: DnaD domain protein [Oscillospiraceae bacterium]|nr:DnaD domain protein [Oscillospiraceae bacterium]
MEIYLNNGHAFPVPVAVADHLLGLASHDQLKVLLFVLCHADETLTEAQIAKSCKVQPAAVEEALVFWQDCNILQNAPAVPSVSVQKTAAEAPPAETATVQPLQQSRPAAGVQNSSRPNLTPGQIAERIQKDPELAEMFRAVKSFTGSQNYTIDNSLVWMHEYLGLQADIILMLAAFCKKIDCFNVRYMEQIAVEWQERGITTHKLALDDINRRTEARSFTGKIKTMFEMDRWPSKKQQAYIDEWQKNGYSLDMIELAYEKTRDKMGDKLKFDYLNGILQRWEQAGIRTPEAAAQEDAAFYAAKKQAKPAGSSAPRSSPGAADSSIDMDEVEKLMNPL